MQREHGAALAAHGNLVAGAADAVDGTGRAEEGCQHLFLVSSVIRTPLGVVNTEVKYPLVRACSSSAALTAAALHTHVRTHRTSSDPAYLHTYVYLYMNTEEEEYCYFRNPGLKRTFG